MTGEMISCGVLVGSGGEMISCGVQVGGGGV